MVEGLVTCDQWGACFYVLFIFISERTADYIVSSLGRVSPSGRLWCHSQDGTLVQPPERVLMPLVLHVLFRAV